MSHHSSRIVERLVAGIALGVAFLVMASVFVPDDSDAGPTHRRDVPHQPLPTEVHSAAVDPALPLGSLESDCYTVEIYASEGEPLYSVYDNTDGRELGSRLTAEQIMWYFPDLRLNVMDFSAPSDALLYVESDHY